jgi:phosphate starvation-inducible PhoH-like protein
LSRKRERNSEETSIYFKAVLPKNDAQERYLNALKSKDIIISTGPAGTGKTFVSTSYAAEQLYYKRIEKLILTRPNVESSETLGFLPGSLNEKYQPYLVPFMETLEKSLGKSFVKYLIESKVIEPVPIGFLRGRTFDNAIVILDEAQNCTKKELKTLLTRIGNNCKMILEGDIDQVDIEEHLSGLKDASDRLSNIRGLEVVKFTEEDIVRSRLCRQIVEAYKD